MKKAIAAIGSLFIVLVFGSCSNADQEQLEDFSMYYRDTLSLSILFPEDEYPRSSFALWTDKQQVKIEENKLFIDEPETITTNLLSFNVAATKTTNGETVFKKIKVRCWIDNIIELEEEKKGWFSSEAWPAVERRFLKSGYAVPVLLTQNDTTYYSDGKKLLWRTKSSKGICSDNFKPRDAKYNQMIKEGRISFIRTGKFIYFSDDNLAHWKTIYQGRQAMRESLVWNSEDSTLIFSEYTPGTLRPRHHIIRYSVPKARLDTVLTFYSKAEHDNNNNLTPFCRHHHVLCKDPYTNDIYLGTGDLDDESKIMRSTDGGKTFYEVGSGSQVWRTLTLMYTGNFIYWGTDSSSPQYLSRLDRSMLKDTLTISTDSLAKFPLLNSALWFAVPYKDLYIMCSNNEGCLYDKYHRIYALKFDEGGTPIVYSCNAEAMDDSVYEQLFIVGFDCEDFLWVCDSEHSHYRKFKVIDNRSK